MLSWAGNGLGGGSPFSSVCAVSAWVSCVGGGAHHTADRVLVGQGSQWRQLSGTSNVGVLFTHPLLLSCVCILSSRSHDNRFGQDVGFVFVRFLSILIVLLLFF